MTDATYQYRVVDPEDERATASTPISSREDAQRLHARDSVDFPSLVVQRRLVGDWESLDDTPPAADGPTGTDAAPPLPKPNPALLASIIGRAASSWALACDRPKMTQGEYIAASVIRLLDDMRHRQQVIAELAALHPELRDLLPDGRGA